jgi:hypothetical protein
MIGRFLDLFIVSYPSPLKNSDSGAGSPLLYQNAVLNNVRVMQLPPLFNNVRN